MRPIHRESTIHFCGRHIDSNNGFSGWSNLALEISDNDDDIAANVSFWGKGKSRYDGT